MELSCTKLLTKLKIVQLPNSPKHKRTNKIWAYPLLFNLASFIGLTIALLDDSWWESLSWLLLIIPVIVSFASLHAKIWKRFKLTGR